MNNVSQKTTKTLSNFFASDSSQRNTEEEKINQDLKNIYQQNIVTPPSYPTGLHAMYDFIAKNTNKPASVDKKKVVGDVEVEISINKMGEMTSIVISNSLEMSCDLEALKIAHQLGKWIPATKGGKTIASKKRILVSFGKEQYGITKEEEVKPFHEDQHQTNDQWAKVDTTLNSSIPKANTSEIDNEIYFEVEQPAGYPAGDMALNIYFIDNLKLPKEIARSIRSKVYIQFVVNIDGTPQDYEVTKSVGKEADAEALRVLKTIKKWNPAKHLGNTVRSYYQVPISF
ncbi:MAG: energy transducer TonB [Pseudarcicella sp.]|nr:energy transducer TonB [Pseudarcicella sp.]MBP6410798.1 energy transducer TonB [Pseudarcicella sp.]